MDTYHGSRGNHSMTDSMQCNTLWCCTRHPIHNRSALTWFWLVSGSPAHQAVLNGLFSPYSNLIVNRLLCCLKQRVPSSQPETTMLELIRRLRCWKESTTTSPSCRHLGHYKVLLPSPSSNLSEYIHTPAGKILSVHLSLLNFCARSGYSLNHWQKIVTMMIPKDYKEQWWLS